VTQSAQPPQPAPAQAEGRGWRINEDWAATAVGLILVLLVLARVIVKAWIP
jgi:hypothetical protein